MKGLSLTQPWATLVAIGAKRIETRSWRTRYRGLVAIHAAKRLPGDAAWLWTVPVFRDRLRAASFGLPEHWPRGAIVATARIADCASTSQDSPYYPADGSDEIAFGDYGPDRWMWVLEEVRRLPEPIPCLGALGLWDVPADVLVRIAQQIEVPA